MSTLTVAVATLSVNKMKMMAGNVYTKFYSANTNGCSSTAQCKQAKVMVSMCTLSSILSILTVVVAMLSLNNLK